MRLSPTSTSPLIQYVGRSQVRRAKSGDGGEPLLGLDAGGCGRWGERPERHSPVVYGTALAQGLRPQMEDCAVVAPLLEGQYLLAACLDGHNGAQVRGFESSELRRETLTPAAPASVTLANPSRDTAMQKLRILIFGFGTS
jgi:hypothetical protein